MSWLLGFALGCLAGWAATYWRLHQPLDRRQEAMDGLLRVLQQKEAALAEREYLAAVEDLELIYQWMPAASRRKETRH